MGSDQRFSLKWNNYQTHLVTAFESLLGDNDFVDVTLGTEGRKLSAHKMLLSACSPYFRELLKDNPCQHPIILLRDVRYDDLYSLLQFMYNGEVNVAQEQLNSFLKSAEALKIRGLTDNEDSDNSNGAASRGSSARTHSPSIPSQPSAAPPARKRRPPPAPEPITPLASAPPPSKRSHSSAASSVPHSRINHSGSGGHHSSEPVKQEIIDLGEDNIEMEGEAEGAEYPVDESTVSVAGTVAQYEGGGVGGGYEEEDNIGDGMLVPEGDESIEDSQEQGSGGGGQGGLGRLYRSSGSAEAGQTLPCAFCEKVFKSQGSLAHHMEVHRGLTSCPLCGRVQSKVSNLKRHLAGVHKVDMELNPIQDVYV